jgi:hypothetical protein
MVVTQLLGGLGNQLFQYAIGRALALRNGAELALDTEALESLPYRRYALGQLRIKGRVLGKPERRTLRLDTGRTRFLTPIHALLGKPLLPVVRERSFSFDASVLEAPSACYLQGYWQSAKYFTGVEAIIRQEVVVDEPLAGLDLEIAESIQNTEAVSMHIRRGDYVANPQTNQYHGLCGPQYYETAQKALLERLDKVHFFVFSDDPDWVEQNLRFLASATIVRHNPPERDYEDLRLLSLCRHHIIANSTFSWWGAWLGSHEDKLVVAPKQWFRAATHRTDDLLPSEWIRL